MLLALLTLPWISQIFFLSTAICCATTQVCVSWVTEAFHPISATVHFLFRIHPDTLSGTMDCSPHTVFFTVFPRKRNHKGPLNNGIVEKRDGQRMFANAYGNGVVFLY